jgi:hypothetical protein
VELEVNREYLEITDPLVINSILIVPAPALPDFTPLPYRTLLPQARRIEITRTVSLSEEQNRVHIQFQLPKSELVPNKNYLLAVYFSPHYSHASFLSDFVYFANRFMFCIGSDDSYISSAPAPPESRRKQQQSAPVKTQKSQLSNAIVNDDVNAIFAQNLLSEDVRNIEIERNAVSGTSKYLLNQPTAANHKHPHRQPAIASSAVKQPAVDDVEFRAAILNNDHAAVQKRLLENPGREISVDCVNFAVSAGDLKMMVILLRHGVQLQKYHLELALENGQFQLAKYIIKSGRYQLSDRARQLALQSPLLRPLIGGSEEADADWSSQMPQQQQRQPEQQQQQQLQRQPEQRQQQQLQRKPEQRQQQQLQRQPEQQTAPGSWEEWDQRWAEYADGLID